MSLKEMLIVPVFLLAGCASRKCEFDITRHFQSSREAFMEISKNYVFDDHDCDDMTQEYKDFLIRSGIEPERIELISGDNTSVQKKIPEDGKPKKFPRHFWMEVKFLTGNLAYDPSEKLYGVNPEIIRSQYAVIKTYPHDYIFDDGSGYKNFGDSYIGGKWIRR